MSATLVKGFGVPYTTRRCPTMLPKIHKGIALSIATVTALGVLAGCGGKEQKPAENTQTPAAQTQPVKLQFWTISLSPTFDDYINSRIDKFEAENEGVTIEWTDLPQNAIEQKLLTAIGSNEAPDVVNLNTSMALTMAQKGALIDLKKEAPDTLAIYQDLLVEGANYKGGIYAYPWYATSAVMIMNTQLLEQAGLDVANPPKTWDEMTVWAKQVREKTGKYAFMPNRRLEQVPMAGVEWLNADKTKAAVNTPNMVSFFKQQADWIAQDLIPHDSITMDFNAALDRFQSGELAFLLASPNFLSRIKQNAPDIYEHVDVAPYILDKGNVLQTSLMNVVVPSAVKESNRAMAIKFANYISNDESQLEFCKIVNILPSTKVAPKDPFFQTPTEDALADKARSIMLDQMAISRDFNLGIGGKQSKISQAYLRILEKAMTGEITPEDATTQLEKEVNDILAQPE